MNFRWTSLQWLTFLVFKVIWWFFCVFRWMNNILLWPKKAHRGLSTQDQTRSSLCICVSFMRQVNLPWHLLSKSLNKNTTEEKSVKPAALTYLTVVCELNSESLRSQCLSFSFSLSLLPLFSVSPFCVLLHSVNYNMQQSKRKVKNK